MARKSLKGTIIDATLIATPSSTKNKQGERDPEMHQTRKGEQWYHHRAEGFAYGIKVHSGVDAVGGLMHSMQTTTANVHALTPVQERPHGEETVVYADSGDQSIDKRPEMASKEITFRVARRPGKRQVLLETSEGKLLNLIETVEDTHRGKRFRLSEHVRTVSELEAVLRRIEAHDGAAYIEVMIPNEDSQPWPQTIIDRNYKLMTPAGE